MHVAVGVGVSFEGKNNTLLIHEISEFWLAVFIVVKG